MFERTVHEHRRSLVAWSVALGGLTLVETGLYPTVRANPQFADLYKSYPEALRSLFGIADMTTASGYLRAEVFSLVAPLLLIVLGVMWGADLIAGEEDRGTIDLLMANPISRRRVVLEKWAALAAGIVVGGAGLGCGLAVGVPATAMHLDTVGVIAACVSSVLLAVLFGSVALAVGAATGRRGVARGVAVALAVLAYLVSSLADLVGWLEPIRPASPWYHALGVDPLSRGFSLLHLGVLAAMVVVTGVVAVAAFERRDLGV